MQRSHSDPGFPRPAPPGPGGRPAPHRSLLPPQIPPQLESRVRRVWKRTRSAPGPASAWRRVPALPYRGLGDVAALSDILAVLLVGHPNPLLGDHLRGATCPKNPSDSLVRRFGAAGRLGSRRFTPPTVTGPGMSERWKHRSVGKPPTTAVRAAEGGGGGPGASGARGREARVQQPESAASSLELLRPGSAANVSTGQTPPRGSADSARSGEGGRGPATASGRPLHAPESAATELRVRAPRPEVAWPGRWRSRKPRLAVSELGETCRGRVRPSVNSHPGAWVSLSGIRWRRPHRC